MIHSVQLEMDLLIGKKILTEVKKTNCNIFALEHDNPKDYKDYVTEIFTIF